MVKLLKEANIKTLLPLNFKRDSKHYNTMMNLDIYVFTHQAMLALGVKQTGSQKFESRNQDVFQDIAMDYYRKHIVTFSVDRIINILGLNSSDTPSLLDVSTEVYLAGRLGSTKESNQSNLTL